tara:strand:+ start:1068 stop:1316 length:249 start_codon:yes stop_codon:yes gene_type:complete
LPLGFLPYHQVNFNEAQEITKLGSDMRVAYQSERLAGTGSLLTATERDMDPTLQARKQAKKNNWFFPLVVLGGFAIFAGILR